jgi:GAF domain-containing protein
MRALPAAFLNEVREDAASYAERRRLERKVGALEESNRRIREELQRAASQHARVAGLLGACHRLHSTLDRATMLIALHEALAGLVGCEEAAVLERSRGRGEFTVAACFGIPERALLPFSEAILASMRAGKFFVGVPDPGAVPRRPSACIPMSVDGVVVGALAIFRLSDRRPALSGADFDLLEMLGAHVATALVATRSSIPPA